MSTTRLRIFHISDLHERGSRDVELWRKRRMFDESWSNNLDELLQDGPFDLVCFTGDAADWGIAAEFKAAGDFLSAICDRLAVPRERLFVVPGNHDVHRKTGEDEWRKMRATLSAGADPQQVSRWINGMGKPPLGVEDGWRAPLLARQENFRVWVKEELKLPEQAEAMGYRVAVPGFPFPFQIAGLNTAWLCGDDADPKNLRLTENQIGRHLTDKDGRVLEGFRLVLLHHPLDELADQSPARRMLADHAHLLLRGHLHEPEVETWIDADHRLVRQLAAGCLYEGHRADQYPNGCQAITISLTDSGEPTEVDVRFRTWSPRGGHWFDDAGIYREAKGGRLTWAIDARRSAAATGAGNPYHPWTPTTTDFVGRAEILRRLETAHDEARGVSLVGDWRMGKSLLLEVWAERVRAKGRVVKRLSGEGAEGVSVGAFVRAVTGLAAADDPDDAADVLSAWIDMVGGPDKAPLVMVDETDGLVRQFGYRFFERLRGMLGRVAFVFASRQELDAIFEKESPRGSPLTNRLEIQWLGLLEPVAVDALVARGAGRFPPGGEAMLRQWAGGHPFFLQLFGHFLVEAHRTGAAANAEAALRQFRTQASPRLSMLWNILVERDREALIEAARTGKAIERLGLKNRGLTTDDGRLFGEVLVQWLREEVL